MHTRFLVILYRDSSLHLPTNTIIPMGVHC
uniref:Uncharacterized protein n=1 Tax=Arundo donax TaxID=35708 RepID=A0A0A9AS71_ARUDO